MKTVVHNAPAADVVVETVKLAHVAVVELQAKDGAVYVTFAARMLRWSVVCMKEAEEVSLVIQVKAMADYVPVGSVMYLVLENQENLQLAFL